MWIKIQYNLNTFIDLDFFKILQNFTPKKYVLKIFERENFLKSLAGFELVTYIFLVIPLADYTSYPAIC